MASRSQVNTYLKTCHNSPNVQTNVEVVGKVRKAFFLCSNNKRGRVGVQIARIPFFVRCFTWNLFLWWQAETICDPLLSKYLLFSFKILSVSSKHKLHLFHPPLLWWNLYYLLSNAKHISNVLFHLKVFCEWNCERFYMIPESLFKRVWSHAYVVFLVVYVPCTDGCLVYYIFAHALVS